MLYWDQAVDKKDLYLYIHLYKSATLFACIRKGCIAIEVLVQKTLYLHVSKTLGDQDVDTKDPPSLPLGPPNDKQEMAQMMKDE